MQETKEIINQVKKIEINTKKLVDGLIAGNYHSIFKGNGIEFSEIRDYRAGDDVRSIDWKVTARFNHPFIKEFIEERDLSIYFAMTSYVIPFFKGLGFGGEGPGGDVLEEASVCEEENLVGSLEKDGDLLYFKHEGEKTRFYIRGNKIYRADKLLWTWNDEEVGEVVEGKIEIPRSSLRLYKSGEDPELIQLLALDNSIIKGNEICES